MPAREIRVTLTGVAGSPWYARHFLDSGETQTDEAATAAVEDFWGALSNYIGSGVTIASDAEVVRWDTPTTVNSIGSVTPFSIPSSGGSNPLPRASQGLVRWRTDTLNGNRRVLGKTFVPFVSEEYNIPGGVVDPTLQGLVNTAAGVLVAEGLVIASLALDAFAPVTSASMWDQWAILRSRRD